LARNVPTCVNLSVGEPGFSPPEHAFESGFQAAAGEDTLFSGEWYIRAERDSKSKAYKDYGLRYDPDSEILIG
jgi:aspartate/methionine/tyrosine aminotransferase